MENHDSLTVDAGEEVCCNQSTASKPVRIELPWTICALALKATRFQMFHFSKLSEVVPWLPWLVNGGPFTLRIS